MAATTDGMDNKANAVWRGFRLRCPHCGAGKLFRGYLRQVESCTACSEPFGHIRVDDFPPYLTIFVVGHLVVPVLLMASRAGFSTAQQIATAVPVTLALIMLLLPRLKGAVLALMWSLRLHGREIQ